LKDVVVKRDCQSPVQGNSVEREIADTQARESAGQISQNRKGQRVPRNERSVSFQRARARLNFSYVSKGQKSFQETYSVQGEWWIRGAVGRGAVSAMCGGKSKDKKKSRGSPRKMGKNSGGTVGTTIVLLKWEPGRGRTYLDRKIITNDALKMEWKTRGTVLASYEGKLLGGK